MSPAPYTINVPQSKLDELKRKLQDVVLPDELSSCEPWSQGPPLADMKRLVETWRTTYDWRTTEARLNRLPNFRTTVSIDKFPDMQIHFLHQRSANPNAIPLLFVHGWPGSFLECLKLRELLVSHGNEERDGADDSASDGDDEGSDGPDFHLVAPSLPNFGLSSGAVAAGFGLRQYAWVLHTLMLQLGYRQYATQAGDWGYWITRAMAHLFPESVRASHYNMIYAFAPSWTAHPRLALQHALTPYSAAEKADVARSRWFRDNSVAYNVLQSTRPQTLAYSLADSPAGLLAWIYEKLRDWSDGYPWSDGEVLDFVSLYWLAEAGPAAAQRIYYEVTNEKDPRLTYRGVAESTPPQVRLGLTYNPKELDIFPRTWGRTLGNVVFEQQNEHGGHFYAHEHPEWLLRDLKTMFGKGGGAYGSIEGRDGYR